MKAAQTPAHHGRDTVRDGAGRGTPEPYEQPRSDGRGAGPIARLGSPAGWSGSIELVVGRAIFGCLVRALTQLRRHLWFCPVVAQTSRSGRYRPDRARTVARVRRDAAATFSTPYSATAQCTRPQPPQLLDEDHRDPQWPVKRERMGHTAIENVPRGPTGRVSVHPRHPAGVRSNSKSWLPSQLDRVSNWGPPSSITGGGPQSESYR